MYKNVGTDQISHFIITLAGCGECNEPHQKGIFKAIDAVRTSPHPISKV
jgi:hypothetical protein